MSTQEIVTVPVRNRKSTTSRTLKIIARHNNIISGEIEYMSFLGRRIRFNEDGTTSTYGSDHAYLIKISDVKFL
jgi:hypothetical protein